MVIWLFFAKRAASKFVAPCIAWIAQRRSATQKLELAIFLDISWVSVSSVTSWCIFQHDFKICVRYHVLFVKGWCLYSSSVKQCLLSVNRDQFFRQLKENGKHKTTFHSTSGWESSLGKIYHRNSTAARTGTWNPARATKKTSSKWLWNTRLIQLHKLQIACMAEKTAVSILIVR